MEGEGGMAGCILLGEFVWYRENQFEGNGDGDGEGEWGGVLLGR